MKAKTKMRIGLWASVAFLCLRIYRAIRFWSLLSYEHKKGLLIGIVILSIYIFGIVGKKLKVCQLMLFAWLFIGIINLLVFLNISVADGRWSGNFDNILQSLQEFLYFGAWFGIITLILWVGLRGLQQMVLKDNQLKNKLIDTASGNR
ncbi:MAG: hypothetical protein ACYS91_18110 [Planctomycetota bacterium]|jgi:uncharacterized membrane protein (DUF441 family)